MIQCYSYLQCLNFEDGIMGGHFLPTGLKMRFQPLAMGDSLEGGSGLSGHLWNDSYRLFLVEGSP